MPISAAAAVRIRRANPVVTARFSLRVLPAGSRVQRAQERSLYLRGNCHALLRHRIDIGLEKSTLWRVMLSRSLGGDTATVTSLIVVVHHQIRTRRQGVAPQSRELRPLTLEPRQTVVGDLTPSLIEDQ